MSRTIPPADAILFKSPAAFFTALLGPRQHDVHVECWRAGNCGCARGARTARVALRRSTISSRNCARRKRGG